MKRTKEAEILANMYDLQSELIGNLAKEVNFKLESHIVEKLKTLGYSFTNREELYEFAKNRLTQINHESSDLCEVHLDFNTINQQLVGVYTENIDIKLDENKVTCTIKVG